VKTWRRPTLGGRRLALERKWVLNLVDGYCGPFSIITLTGLGADVLPWDADLCTHPAGEKCSGLKGCRVEWIYAHVYNATAQARASRLFEAACKSADRWVRRSWAGELPRQLGNCRSPQRRGVDHFHFAMPEGSEVERAWSRHVRRFIEAARRRELLLSSGVVWEALEREWRTGESTRGVYGFGFNHGGRRSGTAAKAARYMARNAAGYMARNADAARARHYVSTRLTSVTGVTMEALRSVNYLWVRRKLIDSGELEDGWIPGYWTDERRTSALHVWALVEAARAP